MKVICTISHEIPRGNGKFDVYEAGKIYDLDKYESRYFSPTNSKLKIKNSELNEEEVITDDSSE